MSIPLRKTNSRPNKTSSTARKRIRIVLLVVVALLVLLRLMTTFITDWMWFAEVGYVDVFFTKLFTQLKIGVPVLILFTIAFNVYLRHLKRGYFSRIVSHEETDLKRLNLITNIISLAFGLVTAFYFATTLWFQMLQFSNSTDFNIADPLFGQDISFYVFRLEFLQQLNEMIIGIILLFIIVSVIYYILLLTMHSPDLYDEDEAEPYEASSANGGPFAGGENNPLNQVFGKLHQSRPTRHVSDSNLKNLMAIASGQLTVLGVVFFLMLGVHFFLKQYDLLHAHTGVVYGAGYTDVHIILWVYRALIALSLAGVVATILFVRKRQIRKLLVVPALMIVVGAGGYATSLAVQAFIVAPDEINKEKAYLASNIEFTQYAYGLENVEVQAFAAENNLSADVLAENVATTSNIRINDYQPVQTFYNQTQSIRQYYTFNDVDVDRYVVGGDYTQTYLSVREIDENKIDNSWLNRHIKYTHGYGVALSRVDTVTASGQPSVLIKNIPPESSIEEVQITRPEVYFGELSNEYILVNTNEKEFDYPDGSENKYTQYEGTAGIKLNLFNRLMFSLREGDLKLLVSGNVSSDSRIIIHRNVMERIRTIMPYLTYDEDPYAVTVDGKIYWMVDAYTTSAYYPYSEPYTADGSNYIRNSIKVVVDAYNGDVRFYIVDDQDPIAQTYKKIFPSLFLDADQMPESLCSHLRYPNALFDIQANVYGRYHMNDVNVFYQKEDLWDIAHNIYGTNDVEMPPNYYIAQLPGEEEAEFISVLPFTPKDIR